MINEVLEMMLLDYATGSLSQPESVWMVTYISLNPTARQNVRRYEALGGALIESLSPAAMTDDCLGRTLAAIDRMERSPQAPIPEEELDLLPGQLMACLARGDIPPEMAWAKMLEGIERCRLLSAAKARQCQQLDLLRLLPGIGLPIPSRSCEREITLVIQGAFEDESGFHRRGEIALITHRTDSQSCREQGCLTLTLTTGPLSPEGRLRRFFKDFLR